MILLDLLLDPKDGYPAWLVITLALLAAIGIFWTKIKSSIEIYIQGKGNISEKKADHELMMKLKQYEEEKETRENEREQAFQEKEKILERLTIVEAQNIKLKQSNTALSIAIVFIFDKYKLDNPENKTVIDRVMKIIEENVAEGSSY